MLELWQGTILPFMEELWYRFILKDARIRHDNNFIYMLLLLIQYLKNFKKNTAAMFLKTLHFEDFLKYDCQLTS